MWNRRSVSVCITMLFIPVVVWAQDMPPRTQNTHSILDFDGLEPPLIDGIFDSGEAWVVSSQAGSSSTVTSRSFWWIEYRTDIDDSDLSQPGVLEGDEEPLDASDCSFRVWTVYDEDYLYVAVEVIDDMIVQRLAEGSEDGETWNEDSVEIFIDGNHNKVEGNVNDHPEEYETGGQFVLTSGGARRDVEAGNPTFGEGPEADWYASVFDNETFDGFIYEFRFKLSSIGNPQKGDIIGFNVAVNDADDSSQSSSRYQMRWVGEAHDESTYGDLLFGRREITAPLITDTITIDGNLDEAAWASAGRDQSNAYLSPFWRASYPISLEDHSFEIFALHDADTIYIAVQVTDDVVVTDSATAGSEGESVWNDDSIEFMIDGDLSLNAGNENAYGSSAKFTIAANAATSYDEGQFIFGEEADTDWYAVPSITDTGYIIEFRAAKAAVVNPLDATQIGFNIAINEDDVEGDDTFDGYQMDWNGTPNNERVYGVVNLGGPVSPVHSWELH